MAGGRRPSNYNPTARPQQPASPPVRLGNGAGPALWAASSIWQPPEICTPPPPPHPQRAYERPAPLPAAPTPQAAQPQAAQLATALDAAVHAAVLRALAAITPGVAPAAAPRLDDEVGSIASSTAERSTPNRALVARLDEQAAVTARLEARLEEQAAQSAQLEARLQAQAARSAELESRLKKQEALKTSIDVQLISQAAENNRLQDGLATAEAANAELEKRLAVAEREVARANAQTAALSEKLRTVRQARQAPDRARREPAAPSVTVRQLDRLEASLTPQLHALSLRVAGIEASAAAAATLASQRAEAEDTRCTRPVAESPRADAGVGGLRARLKRVEARLDQAEESAALMTGALDAATAGCTTASGDVARLKKLVEVNLRAHADMEEIIRNTVSSITRNVCQALKGFTNRRIQENNAALCAKFAPVVDAAQ